MSLEKIFRKAETAYRAGKYLDALGQLKKLERDVPRHPEVVHLKGVCLFEAKRFAEAEKVLSLALELKGELPELLDALAATCNRLGDYDRAEALYRRALAIRPTWNVLSNYGVLLKTLGRFDEAIACHERAVSLRPDAVDAWDNLAGTLFKAGNRKSGLEALRRIAELRPDKAETWSALGYEAFISGDRPAARAAIARALALDPADNRARLADGLVKVNCGDAEAGVPVVRKALEGPLSPEEFSVAVFALNYGEDVTPKEIRRVAASWGKRFGEAPPLTKRGRDWAPGERLRVGIVAAHFGQHPAAFFMREWVPHAAEVGMDVTMFHVLAVPDDVKAMWPGVAEWVPLGMDDRQAAVRIADRQIDVLINASGHADNSGIGIFAHRPAPVQVLAFAHFCTTGMAAFDAVIADRFQVADGGEAGFSEKIVRLPHDYVCYRAPAYAPEIASPAAAEGPLLGCFNNPSKYGPRTARLWSAVLAAVPSARLLLKASQFADAEAVATVGRLLQDAGVDPARVIFEGASPHPELLAAYNRIDLALDPLAYSGGLTTLEALWMGVPVVTLPGEKYCARHGLTHLGNAGLERFVARDEAHYVEIAKAWLEDTGDLVTRKRAVRESVRSSPISDGAAYARDLAEALRQVCAG